MRFSGSLAAINNALDGLVFRAAPGFAGEGSIQIAANDGGNTGSGGAAGNAGAIVVKDVPADALAVSRVKQQNKEKVAAALRKRLKAEKERKLKENES